MGRPDVSDRPTGLIQEPAREVATTVIDDVRPTSEIRADGSIAYFSEVAEAQLREVGS